MRRNIIHQSISIYEMKNRGAFHLLTGATFLFVIASGLLAGYGIRSLSSDSSQVPETPNIIQVGLSSKEIHVGTFSPKTVNRIWVPVQNSLTEPIHVANLAASCGCTVPSKVPFTLTPGEEVDLALELSTKDVTTSRLADLTASVSIGNRPAERIKLATLHFSVNQAVEPIVFQDPETTVGLPEESFAVLVDIPSDRTPDGVSADMLGIRAPSWGNFQVEALERLSVGPEWTRFRIWIHIESLFNGLAGKLLMTFPSNRPESSFDLRLDIQFDSGIFLLPRKPGGNGEIAAFDLCSIPNGMKILAMEGGDLDEPIISDALNGAAIRELTIDGSSVHDGIKEVLLLVNDEERFLGLPASLIGTSFDVLTLDQEWSFTNETTSSTHFIPGSDSSRSTSIRSDEQSPR